MKYDFDPKALTSEKSLWDVYVLSRKIPASGFNRIVLVSISSILTIYAFFVCDDVGLLLKSVRDWSSIGLSFSLSVLGFLIAGFTIFATLTKPEMLLSMMSINHKQSGLPYLKYNFFAFMRVFIYYLVISFLCLSVVLFGKQSGIVSTLIGMIPYAIEVKVVLVKLFYVLIGSGLLFLILLLKTFIFNIYSIVMNHLRWEVDGPV